MQPLPKRTQSNGLSQSIETIGSLPSAVDIHSTNVDAATVLPDTVDATDVFLGTAHVHSSDAALG